MSRGVMIAIGVGIAAVVSVARPDAQARRSTEAFDAVVTGSGRPIVLIPGLSTTGDVWDSTVAHLKGRYQVHVLTLAGFGGPTPLGDPFLPKVIDALVHYATTHRLDRPVLVGHSLGGFVAFAAAARAPESFGGVVAVDGVPFLPALGNPAATADQQRTHANQIKAMYASLTPDQMAAQSRLALRSMITDPADVERAAAWSRRSDPSAVGVAVAEMMTTDLRVPARAIDLPVLLIGALGAAPEAMRPAFRAAYEAQVAGLPRAEVIFADRARHFVMLDDPAFLFASLDRFLTSAVSGAR